MPESATCSLGTTGTTYKTLEKQYCEGWLRALLPLSTRTLKGTCRDSLISANPIITLDYVLEHPASTWVWSYHIGEDSATRTRDLPIYLREYRVGLLGNPNMSEAFLLEHLDQHPEWGTAHMGQLSRHSCLSLALLLKFPHLGWDLIGIAHNSRITHSLIQQLPDDHPLRKPLLGPDFARDWSRNPSLELAFLETHPYYPWSMSDVSRHIRLQPCSLTDYGHLEWDIDQLSLNTSLTLDIIQQHPTAAWNWAYLSHRDTIPLSMLGGSPRAIWGAEGATDVHNPHHSHLNWEWGDRIDIVYENIELYQTVSSVDGHGISNHPSITWNFILQHRHQPWSLEALSGNPHLEPDFEAMQQLHPDLSSYNWGELSAHPKVTWEMVQAHPNLPWDHRGLSVNPNITAEHRRQFPEKILYPPKNSLQTPTKSFWYGHNSNLTLDEVAELAAHSSNILRNPLHADKKRWLDTRRLQHIAALRLARFARDTLYNPVYARARRHLACVCLG